MRKKPGAIALTRTPEPAHWVASSRVSISSAALLALYAGVGDSVKERMPAIEAMLRTVPHPRGSM